MSVAGKAQLARRSLLKSVLGAAGLAIVAVAVVESPRLFTPAHAPSPFDDLLAQLPDRENAARLGGAFLATAQDFDAVRVARALRERLAHRPLSAALQADVAAGRMAEAHGWVLPETLVLLCGLAAKAAA
ncbi:MAG TPA: hypothetical protein VIY09_00320 [Rhizomicrobium sp.]